MNDGESSLQDIYIYIYIHIDIHLTSHMIFYVCIYIYIFKNKVLYIVHMRTYVRMLALWGNDMSLLRSLEGMLAFRPRTSCWLLFGLERAAQLELPKDFSFSKQGPEKRGSSKRGNKSIHSEGPFGWIPPSFAGPLSLLPVR